jgi:hypothetical protein
MTTIVPARDGYWLLTYGGKPYDPDYSREPVIAWAITDPIDPTTGEWRVNVTPITSKGPPSDRPWAVLHPNGALMDNVHYWNDLEHWLAHNRSQGEDKAKKKTVAVAA